MIASSEQNLHGGAEATFAGTREQFARALSSLGAGIEAAGGATVDSGLRRVMLRCPYERWAATIGPLPCEGDHFAPGGGVAFQMWRYRCDDGFVQCVGRKQRFAGQNESILVRAVVWG